MVGFPIRRSPDQRLYTAPRGLSQCPTSFIGIWRLGIHRKPFVAYFRDTENSIFFAFSCVLVPENALFFRELLLASYAYSVGKVQTTQRFSVGSQRPNAFLLVRSCLSN